MNISYFLPHVVVEDWRQPVIGSLESVFEALEQVIVEPIDLINSRSAW